MSFAFILTLLSAISGLIFLLDIFIFSKRRKPDEAPNKLIEYSRSFFPVFFFVLLLRSFLMEPFRIPSGSLEPTLLVGDFLVVNKFSYGLRLPVSETKILSLGSPKNGDIAVFRWPPDPDKFDYIKRVIGVPGDHIKYQNKVLTINNQEMKQVFQDYTVDASSGRAVSKYQEHLMGVTHDIYINQNIPAHDFEVTVPEGYYFMMGDNRDNSADSRYWGFVSEKNLRGKAALVWMSWDSAKNNIRFSRIGHFIH